MQNLQNPTQSLQSLENNLGAYPEGEELSQTQPTLHDHPKDLIFKGKGMGLDRAKTKTKTHPEPAD